MMRHFIGILIFVLSFTIRVFMGKNFSFRETKVNPIPPPLTNFTLEPSWVYMSDVKWEHPPKEILEDYEDKFQIGRAVFLIFYPTGEFFKLSCNARKLDSGRIDAFGPDTVTYKGVWKYNDDGSLTITSQIIESPIGW